MAQEEGAAAAEPPPVSFRRDVAPALLDRCLGCHGGGRKRGSYSVETYSALLEPGRSDEPPIVPGKPDESYLYRLLVHDDPDERMPQDGDKLPETVLATVRRWIEEGAKYDGTDPTASLATIIVRSRHPLPPEPYGAPVPITALVFSPDGKELAASGYHEVTVWNPDTGQIVRRLPNLEQRILALEWSRSGEFLAVAGGTPGRHGEVAILDPRTGRAHLRVASASDIVSDVALDPSTSRIAAAMPDGTVAVYEIPSGRELLRVRAHSDWVLGVSFSADGKRLATASRDKTARVYDVESGDLLATYSGHSEAVVSVSFDPAEPSVWTASADRRIHRFKIDDGNRNGEIGGFGGEICALRVEGDLIYSACADGTTRIHKRGDRAQLHRLEGHGDWVYSVAADPIAGRVASGSFTGEIRVWKIEDGALVVSFTAVPPPRELREL